MARIRSNMPDARDVMPAALPKLRDFGASIGLTEPFRGTSMCKEAALDANGTILCAPSMIQIGCNSVGQLSYQFHSLSRIHGQYLLAALVHEQQLVKFSLDGRNRCSE